MDIDQFLASHAALVATPSYALPWLHSLDVGNEDIPYLALVRKATVAHMWLQTAIRGSLPAGDVRHDVLEHASEHAAHAVRLVEAEITRETRWHRAWQLESLDVSTMSFTPRRDPSGPDIWLSLGLSALFLELMIGKACSLGDKTPRPFSHRFDLMAQGFGLERSFALAEAVGRGRVDSIRVLWLREAIERFRVPAEEAWGTPFIVEARQALARRFPSHRVLIHAALTAIRSTPGLPQDAWLYVEPHLKRHGALFGIGLVRRGMARAALAAIRLF